MRRCCLALLLWVVGGCMPSEQVVRIVDGELRTEHAISARAYAAYARGIYFEQRGSWEQAALAYREAVDADPSSPMPWIRLGAVTCQLAEDARPAFRRAEKLDARQARLWDERAECAKARGHIELALLHARRAFSLAPLSDEVNARLIELEREAGNGRRASRLARAFADLTAIHRSVEPTNDTIRPSPSASAEAPAIAARRAFEQGALGLAMRQAELALDADPNQSEVWVLLLTAADLAQDDERWRQALERLGPRPGPLSKRGRTRLVKLLERRLSPEIAALWLTRATPEPPPAPASP